MDETPQQPSAPETPTESPAAPQTPLPIEDVAAEAKKQFAGLKEKFMTLPLFKKIIVASAAAVVIFSFFPAYTYGSALYTQWVTSLFSPLGKLAFLLSLIVSAIVMTPLFTTKLPKLPWSYEKITFVGAIATLSLSIFQLLNYTFDNSVWGGPDIGLFLVCAASILMTYSAYHEQKNPVQQEVSTSTEKSASERQAPDTSTKPN
ncbi:hypothetical protein KBB08_04405 [Candidatus Gracilibacteria bacterium]|nr:hypothetical protein [Candidatus Gracilibacteria bacterium]